MNEFPRRNIIDGIFFVFGKRGGLYHAKHEKKSGFAVSAGSNVYPDVSADRAGGGGGSFKPAMYATFWALIPPVVAIALALITKEVYSSLFIGILVGALFYSGFSFEGTIVHIFQGGIISVLSDSYNVGILVFLVILGQWWLL